MSSFLTRFRISINIWLFWLVLSISNLKVARKIFTLVTKPKSWQKSWMKLDPQEKTILWVAEGVASQKQEELYDRIRNADVVLFWSHGKQPCIDFFPKIRAHTKSRLILPRRSYYIRLRLSKCERLC